MEEVPFEDRTVPRVELDWGRSFWWWYPISRAIGPAIRMTSLLPSILALVLLQTGLSQAENWFKPTLKFSTWLSGLSGNQLLRTPMQAPPEVPQFSLDNLAYLTFAILWIALIASLFGGVIARRAAVELGQRTVAPWMRSIQLVLSRTVHYVWAAGLHIVAFVLLLLPVAILGWFARLGSIPAVLAGIAVLVVCLPLIFSVGRLAMSLILCYPLSVCAISIEKRADSFEGFSRSNAYFFQRPVLSVLCVALLVLFGEVGSFLVSWTVQLGWGLIQTTYNSAKGVSLVDADGVFLALGNQLAVSLVTAFRFSYFWSAAAGLYLVLRKCVDNTDLDEMDVLESELEQNPPRIPTVSQPMNSAGSSAEAAATAVNTTESATGESATTESTTAESPSSETSVNRSSDSPEA